MTAGRGSPRATTAGARCSIVRPKTGVHHVQPGANSQRSVSTASDVNVLSPLCAVKAGAVRCHATARVTSAARSRR